MIDGTVAKDGRFSNTNSRGFPARQAAVVDLALGDKCSATRAPDSQASVCLSADCQGELAEKPDVAHFFAANAHDLREGEFVKKWGQAPSRARTFVGFLGD